MKEKHIQNMILSSSEFRTHVKDKKQEGFILTNVDQISIKTKAFDTFRYKMIFERS